jgi:hypothetical protein
MLFHRFQQLAFVKDILTNEEKRRVYDGDNPVTFIFVGAILNLLEIYQNRG